nr:MAG TPA: hypothetical protein [Caudoviricetes sp.]DAR82255.1 MAG TPA: hypothetical protein [Caudoviricetes sp.]DAX73669.1 MAG TPA: hypothetical protein [Caudoviricetes sp.]
MIDNNFKLIYHGYKQGGATGSSERRKDEGY